MNKICIRIFRLLMMVKIYRNHHFRVRRKSIEYELEYYENRFSIYDYVSENPNIRLGNSMLGIEFDRWLHFKSKLRPRFLKKRAWYERRIKY